MDQLHYQLTKKNTKKIQKKYLTSFLRSGIGLENFNLIVFFFHKSK